MSFERQFGFKKLQHTTMLWEASLVGLVGLQHILQSSKNVLLLTNIVPFPCQVQFLELVANSVIFKTFKEDT